LRPGHFLRFSSGFARNRSVPVSLFASFSHRYCFFCWAFCALLFLVSISYCIEIRVNCRGVWLVLPGLRCHRSSTSRFTDQKNWNESSLVSACQPFEDFFLWSDFPTRTVHTGVLISFFFLPFYTPGCSQSSFPPRQGKSSLRPPEKPFPFFVTADDPSTGPASP